jgi:hypothetical protein
MTMGIEDTYRYRVYDKDLDDYVYSTRYATMVKINRLAAVSRNSE